MASSVSAQYKDNAGQKSTVTFTVRDMTSANMDDIADEFSALRAALEPYTLGNLQNYELVQNKVFVSQGKAASIVARREMKILWSYEDSVTHKMYQHETPAPELTNSALWISDEKTGRTFIVKSGAEWTAWLAAFETLVVSPDGNPVILQTGELVGRNL